MRGLARLAATPTFGIRAERLLELLSFEIADPSMPLGEVLRVTARLDAAAAQYWLGGGWGLDSLLGFQSRIHHDIDLVLKDYDEALPTVTTALQDLGYAMISADRSAAWLPRRTTFMNVKARVIEVLGVDWEMVDAAWTLLGSERPASVTRQARQHFFTTGSLADRPVPSLTREAQTLFHLGYRQKPRDRRNIERLRALDPISENRPAQSPVAPARTALLVPVFALDGNPLRIWSEQADADCGLPPHVTVLYPFLPGDKIDSQALEKLTAICAAAPRFAFDLPETGWFDNRVLYLAPSPSQPFAELTRSIAAAFPECLPYDGAFATTVPHLTVGENKSAAALRRAEIRMRRFLPVSAEATHVWLMTCAGPGEEWKLARFFPLGPNVEAALAVGAGASSRFAPGARG
jgi:hypothetical protein